MTIPCSSRRLSCSEKSAICWRNSSTEPSSPLPLAGGVVLARHAHQLLEVLEPYLGLHRALRPQRLGVARLLERLRKQVSHPGPTIDALAQALHHGHEAADGLDRRRGQAGDRLGARRDVPDRLAQRVGVPGEPPLRRRADAALGLVDHARERHRVGRVHEQGEVGERVLDLLALVEARAADHLVADPVAHEHVLEHAALGVGPVEDGDLVARLARVDEPLDLRHHEARLGVLVLELAHVHRVAVAQLAPERLVLARAVVRDHRVGRVQDRLRGAVVLLELDHLGVREVVLEVEDVADVGAAEAVDRLVVVAHHAEVAVLLREELKPAILGPVGVLVLVDQHVPEAPPVAVAHLLEELEQVHAAEQQVVEVHRVGAVQALLVEPVDVGGGLLEEALHLELVGLGVEQLVLRVRDLAPDAARGEALGIDVQLLDAVLDQPQRVLLVVDREAAGVAEPLGVGPQHSRAGGVEGHHPHRARAPAHQGLHPLAHLLRRLVRERDREDLAGPRLAGADQMGDPVREHARLARAGAREDEERPLGVQHGLALGLVESLEQLVGGGFGAHRSEDRSATGRVRGRGGRSRRAPPARRAPGRRSPRPTGAARPPGRRRRGRA